MRPLQALVPVYCLLYVVLAAVPARNAGLASQNFIKQSKAAL